MKLTVKTLKGTQFEIRVQPNDTVSPAPLPPQLISNFLSLSLSRALMAFWIDDFGGQLWESDAASRASRQCGGAIRVRWVLQRYEGGRFRAELANSLGTWIPVCARVFLLGAAD
jgi:hypothetical protein